MAPAEGGTETSPSGQSHYTDPVWDTVRMNNIAQHFAAAWFGLKLQNRTEMGRYLKCGDDAEVWPGFEREADGGEPDGLALQSAHPK